MNSTVQPAFKQGATVPVSPEIAKDIESWRGVMETLYSMVEEDLREYVQYGHLGPHLGPGRPELRVVLRPYSRRRSVLAMMPGKKPSRYVARRVTEHDACVTTEGVLDT